MADIILTVLDKLFFAIIVGIIANGLFFLALSRLKPKIAISPIIASGKSTIDGRKIFRIKVINRTKSPVIQIRATLYLMRPSQTHDGEILKSRAIRLNSPDPMVFDGFLKSDVAANYAIVLLRMMT